MTSSFFVFGVIPEEERAALIALYNQTNGGKWDNYLRWRTPPLHTDGFSMPGTEATWHGIFVKEDHVIKIDLKKNNLNGTLPKELGNLSYLKYLDLHYNQLKGNIPSELGNLKELTYLTMGNNRLSGNIPPELGNLINLLEINFSDNSLSGSIPPQIGNLINMVTLRLDNNRLTGPIPSELKFLSSLKVLLLSKNQLEGTIPIELADLNQLIVLDLGSNNLTGSIPGILGKMGNLVCLLLCDNCLTGGIPPELSNLTKLSSLYLYGNQLSGAIPVELGKLVNLSALYLNDNNLTGSIPPELGDLTNLFELNLENNNLSGIIPHRLGRLNQLRYIYLSGNQLSGPIPSRLGNLGNIRRFFLSKNQLTGDIPVNLINLKNVVTFDIRYNCLTAADPVLLEWLKKHAPDWNSEQNQCGIKTSKISLSSHSIQFTNFGPQSKKVRITNTGKGTLNWKAYIKNADWIGVYPISGTGDSTITLSPHSDADYGCHGGKIEIADSNAVNSPQIIDISLHVYRLSGTEAPFGNLDTPSDGSTVEGSIPISGWALDDVGIKRVSLYCNNRYIGDGVFINGARPDIEIEYPQYSQKCNAGWGYMLMTNALANGGNGTYTLTAIAEDWEGNSTTLGSKTIYIDNKYSKIPFGTIDTPIQGGTASGREFINFGWALTPLPNIIPFDGSTIDVTIDGVFKGHPVYNRYRMDIALFFNGYANIYGAGGYFKIDTRKLENGLHTIAWNITDSEGNRAGIGSRFFTVDNPENNSITPQIYNMEIKDDSQKPLSIMKNASNCTNRFTRNQELSEILFSGDECTDTYRIKELESIKIALLSSSTDMNSTEDLRQNLASQIFEGYLVVGDQLRPLPVGSTLEQESGTFYWLPGPGFIGKYHFVFYGKDDTGQDFRKNIIIEIY